MLVFDDGPTSLMCQAALPGGMGWLSPSAYKSHRNRRYLHQVSPFFTHVGEEGDGNQSHPMQGLLVNASEGAGRVDFPCYYLVGALFSSMGKGLKGRVTLRAESYCVWCTTHGTPQE